MKFVSQTKDTTSDVALFDKLKWLNTKEGALYLRTTAEALRTRVCRSTLIAYHYGRQLRSSKLISIGA